MTVESNINRNLWQGDHVARYANRQLKPVEAVVLARYSQDLSGRVLEIGCGAGRILGYLTALSDSVYGTDINPDMLDYCREHYPTARVYQSDLLALGRDVSLQFDTILIPDNTLDVAASLHEREQILTQIRGILKPDGLLIFSSHNIDWQPTPQPATNLLDLSPVKIINRIRRDRRRRHNQRKLGGLSRRYEDYAILNDVEGDYGSMFFYIGRKAQEAQLERLGFDVVECLDVDGRTVVVDERSTSPWLHYVARPTTKTEGGTHVA